ncbi:MAG: pth, partial [Phycisphaerales bacterium]|nr:pth [Phycisphaerales bacterium]
GEFDRVAKAKFDGLAMDGVVRLSGGGSEKVMLLKPTTYMNLSGRAVQAAMAFYQLSPGDVLVVLDDLALPCGKIRLRAGGSSGGHNGLKDIERALGTSNYPRLRLGVDAPPPRVPGKDYVLGRFSEEQRKAIDPAIDRAADATLTWIESGIQTAMNRFNADEKEV